MNCERCTRSMQYQYEVEERKVCFVLWECECGHKILERRKIEPVISHASR